MARWGRRERNVAKDAAGRFTKAAYQRGLLTILAGTHGNVIRTLMPLVITDKDGNDSIAIRSVVHLTLGYDHRLIDGAVADQFMAQVKKNLESWGEDVG